MLGNIEGGSTTPDEHEINGSEQSPEDVPEWFLTGREEGEAAKADLLAFLDSIQELLDDDIFREMKEEVLEASDAQDARSIIFSILLEQGLDPLELLIEEEELQENDWEGPFYPGTDPDSRVS